jgi:hypothetical protein
MSKKIVVYLIWEQFNGSGVREVNQQDLKPGVSPIMYIFCCPIEKDFERFLCFTLP